MIISVYDDTFQVLHNKLNYILIFDIKSIIEVARDTDIFNIFLEVDHT